MIFLGFSNQPSVQLRLPAGAKSTSEVFVIVQIRDKYDYMEKYQIPPISVVSDSSEINKLIDILQMSKEQRNSDSLLQLLANGDQNSVGQIVTSLSQQMNSRNEENIDEILLSASSTEYMISSLDERKRPVGSLNNDSLIDQYKKQLNIDAMTREYLILTTTKLAATTVDSIKLQASTLAQLTRATNQLTRTAAVSELFFLKLVFRKIYLQMQASNKCYQLAVDLKAIEYEDVLTSVSYIAQCASNVLTVREFYIFSHHV